MLTIKISLSATADLYLIQNSLGKEAQKLTFCEQIGTKQERQFQFKPRLLIRVLTNYTGLDVLSDYLNGSEISVFIG